MAEDRFERLANLVTYLLDAGERRSRGATYADIVGSIPGYPEGDDARRRAFERDKKLLRDEDIPLVEEDGRYRIPPDDYYLPDLGLTEDEQLALQLAVAAVPVGGEGGHEGLRKLTGGLGVAGGGGGVELADLDEHPLLPTLHAAIRKRSTVRFVRDGADRTVEPASLFFRDGHWYLFGRDRLRDADRNFRVDRIGDGVTIGEPGGFEARPSAPAASDEMMPKQPWLFGDDDPDDGPEIAVVRVDAVLAAKAAADAGPSASVWRDASDGSVTLTMPVRQRASFREWVLGMLDHAEVVGPPALREDVVTWLRAMS